MQRRERNWLTVWRSYPCREAKPPVSAGEGDLVYPAWMEGKGNVTSTLVGQVARLAPTVVTLGFEINRRHLNEPVSFEVRFQEVSTAPLGIRDSFLPKIQAQIKAITATPEIVADWAFNRLNIAKAYLGKVQFKTLVRLATASLSVKVDPTSRNLQITWLRTGHQLISIVKSRAS